MKISTAHVAVVDVESTGLDYAAGDRVVEIAARFLGSGDHLSMLVNPGRSIPVLASAVHGIVDEDVAHAISLDDAYAKFDAFLVPPDAPLVSHNCAFDRSFLPTLADRKWICSMRLSKHLLPDAPGYSNAVLRYYLGFANIETGNLPMHRAAADVIVTSAIFERLLEHYLAAGRPDDIDALLAFAAAPIRLQKLKFGSAHYDKPMAEVPLSYFEWMLGPKGPIDRLASDPDLLHSIRCEMRERGRRLIA